MVYSDDAQYILSQEGPATARLRVADIAVNGALGALLFDFIFNAKSGGVRIVVQWAESPPEDVFTLDAGPGLDIGHLASSRG